MTARDVEKDRLNGISNGMQLGCKLPDDEQICPNDCQCVYWDPVITTPIPCENLTLTPVQKCPECNELMTLADEEIEGQGKSWLCQDCCVHIPACEGCAGAGWITTQQFHKPGVKDGTVDVERCDTCQVFANDQEARDHVARISTKDISTQ